MELFAEIGDVDGGGSGHSNFVQNNPPLAPPPSHCASLVDHIEVDSKNLDEEYVANSNESDSSGDDEVDGGTVQYLLLASKPVPKLSVVASHYHTLNLNVMHEDTPFFNMGGDDYNTDDSMEFRIGHKFKSREAVMLSVNNYNIRMSAEYNIVESDRAKYHMHCRQATAECHWNLHVTLKQNLGYW
ncbi:hypothetical protein Ahy_A03g015060 [Arachis hypogaea]|uniref:Transposase MuDR plant domain-containing protein n=1 Tax=Arachis hypogaea TaxID=3818 RepID=A0A445DZL0_ARAHY|nr:hypothetical protein Ahy_A03g015060 [Arachis hypogaea]